MEGLRGVQYTTSQWGSVRIELSFLDPPPHIIDALEYAMLNDLTFAVPGGSMSGSLSPILMKILNIDITSDIEEVEYDFGLKRMLIQRHRFVRVRARSA